MQTNNNRKLTVLKNRFVYESKVFIRIFTWAGECVTTNIVKKFNNIKKKQQRQSRQIQNQ